MFEEKVKLEISVPVHLSDSALAPPEKPAPIGVISNMHLHKEYEVLYVARGQTKCVTPTCEYVFNEGDIIFVNSYTPHSMYRLSDGAYQKVLQFDMSVSSENTFKYVNRYLTVQNAPVVHFKRSDDVANELASCFIRITEEYFTRGEFWYEYVNAYLCLMIAILKRCGVVSDNNFKDTEAFSRIRPVIEYINENYYNRITTSQLCEIVNLNESYFCRVFKNTIGISAMNYINFVRVCWAEYYLQKGEKVSDVAYKTGFSTLSHFNFTFKKYMQITPREFRKAAKSRKI